MLPKFEIFGWAFYTYPLLLGLIWGMGWEYAKSLRKNLKSFGLLFFLLFISSWTGAKLLFLLTLENNISSQLLDNADFWMGGGFVFLGGLGGGIAILVGHKILTKQKWNQYQFLLLPLVLGHSLGRVACFLAGCCYGTTCDLPWAISLHGHWRHPVQLYEASALFLLFLILRLRHNQQKPLLTYYLVSYLSLRFFLEFFRGDTIRGIHFWGLSTSQLISLSMLLILAAFALQNARAGMKTK